MSPCRAPATLLKQCGDSPHTRIEASGRGGGASGSRLGAWALGLAFLLLLGASAARAQDNLQRAREALEIRDMAGAVKYIEAEIARNPGSWEAFYMLGEYQKRDLEQPKQALESFQRAWTLAGAQHPTGNQQEQDDFKALGESLQTLYQEAVAHAREARGEEGMIKALETIIRVKRFYSLPLARQLLELYNKAARWADILAVARDFPAAGDPSVWAPVSGDRGWIDYWTACALLRTGETFRAYVKFQDALKNGVDVATQGIGQAQDVLMKAAKPQVDHAQELYDRKDFVGAAQILGQVVRELPPEMDLCVRARELISKAKSGVSISWALKEVERLKEQHKYDDALAAAAKALESYPADATLTKAYNELASLKSKLEKDAAAAQEDADRKERQTQEAYVRLMARAAEANRAGRPCDEVDSFKEALKLKVSDDLKAQIKEAQRRCGIQEDFQQGQNFFGKQMYPAALEELQKVMAVEPGFRDFETIKLMALCYFGMGQIEKGRELAEKYSEGHEDADCLLKLADLAEKGEGRHDWERAITYLQRAEKARGSDPILQQRIDALSWLLNRRYYFGGASVVLGYVLIFLYLKHRPRILKRVLLSDLERNVQKREYRQALATYDRVLALPLTEREEIGARTQFARAFFEIADYSHSVSECQQVLRATPENKQVRTLMARALYGTKTISPEVLPYYLDLLEAEPQNREMVTFVGTFCSRKKVINATTIPILRQLAGLNPEDDKLRELLVKIYLKESDHGAQALSLMELERKKNPKNLDVRCFLAEEYLRKGDIPRAIEECEAVINEDIYHQRTHKILVDAYRKMGKIDVLIKIYEGILAQDPRNGVVAQMLSKLMNPDVSGKLSRDASGTLSRQDTLSRSGNLKTGDPGASSSQTMRAGGASGSGSGAAAAPAPAGLPSEAAADTTDPGVAATENAGPSTGVPCPKCGKRAPAGAYYCTCGQPIH